MAYKLGVAGLGHWFERLLEGMGDSDIELFKAAGSRPAEAKAEQLQRLGIPEENYYVASGSLLPDGFFDGVDIVQIANPNSLHSSQTIQSLEKGKVTFTEKTWGVNRREFYDVVEYVRANGLEAKAYLHLHYLHKRLTMELPQLLDRLSGANGKITDFSATFFEPMDKENIGHRAWLFSAAEGGVFMDWIHPFEILFHGAMAESASISSLRLFAVNSVYKGREPTGVEAGLSIRGDGFSSGARGTIRVAKDTDGVGRKAAVISFESGAQLQLEYQDSETEFRNGTNGSWRLVSGHGEVLEKGSPIGSNTSVIMVKDMLERLNGRMSGLGVQEICRLYEPQWRYQELAPELELKGGESAQEFITAGACIGTEV